MNEELLKQAVKAIEVRPDGHDQSTWGHSPLADAIYAEDRKRTSEYNTGWPGPTEEDRRKRRDEINAWWTKKDELLRDIIVNPEVCGTMMCLAGHAVTQAGYRFNEMAEIVDPGEFFGMQVEHVARTLLDLEHDHACIDAGDVMECTPCTIFDSTFGQDKDGNTTVESFKAALTEITGVEFD